MREMHVAQLLVLQTTAYYGCNTSISHTFLILFLTSLSIYIFYNIYDQVKDRLVSQAAQPSSVNDRTSVRSELRRAMEDLSPREAQIIEMRFGLADGNQMTLEEIGKHFRVTRERIRQVGQ